MRVATESLALLPQDQTFSAEIEGHSKNKVCDAEGPLSHCWSCSQDLGRSIRGLPGRSPDWEMRRVEVWTSFQVASC